MIGDVSLEDYFISAGYSESEAETYVALFASDYTSMSGSVEVNEDGTYDADFDGTTAYSGVWELSSDGTTFTLDKDTDSEQVYDVVTLTDSKLTLEMTESESMSGIDMDIIVTMTFTR